MTRHTIAFAVFLVSTGMWVVPRSASAQCPHPDGARPTDQAQGDVYDACTVDTPARLRRRSPLRYVHGRFSGDPMVARVTFVVDTLGSPERGTVRLNDPGSPDLTFAVVTAIMQQLYEPAMLRGRKVRQVATYGWMLYDRRPRDIDPVWGGTSVSTPPAFVP